MRTRKAAETNKRTLWIEPGGAVEFRVGGRGYDGRRYPISDARHRPLWREAQALGRKIDDAIKAGILKPTRLAPRPSPDR